MRPLFLLLALSLLVSCYPYSATHAQAYPPGYSPPGRPPPPGYGSAPMSGGGPTPYAGSPAPYAAPSATVLSWRPPVTGLVSGSMCTDTTHNEMPCPVGRGHGQLPDCRPRKISGSRLGRAS